MTMYSLLKTSDGTQELQEFQKLALRYSEIALSEGITVRPFVSPELPLLSKASADELKDAIMNLQNIVSIHEQTLAAGESPISSGKLIWRALKKFQLIPAPDFFQKLTDEDIVLIYSEEHKVLFWNLQFFKFSSFSIEQLFFAPWFTFTKRETAIQGKLHELVLNVVAGKLTGTFKPDVPGHEVQELNSAELIRSWMEVRLVSVLTRNNYFAGYMAVQTMRILGEDEKYI